MKQWYQAVELFGNTPNTADRIHSIGLIRSDLCNNPHILCYGETRGMLASLDLANM